MNFEFGKYNLHTHSFYCGHGEGLLKDYVREAKNNSIELLGFSEHCPVKENRWAKSRMSYDTVELYLEDIESLKYRENELAEKVQLDNEDVDVRDKQLKPIKLLSGFECDYFKEYDSYLREVKERCDYLIFGVHYLMLPSEKDLPLHYHPLNKKALSIYADQYIKSMDSNIFSLCAHPDLFFNQYFKWDEQAKAISKEIIEAAVYYDIPLEINGNGILKEKVKGFNNDMRFLYPVKEFWDLAKSYDKLKIVSNSDAHSPINLKKGFDECKKFADDLSIDFSKANIDRIRDIHKVEFIK